ncbi:MAG: hypothetical protein WCT01_04420 [Candidatus Shapirobacteria bacterium]
MKLFDLILILFILLFSAFHLVPSSANDFSLNNTPTKLITKQDMSFLDTTNLALEQVYYDYLNSTKLILKTKSVPSLQFTAYLNPNVSYSHQFDLIQIAQKSSKIISRQLLVIDLASPQPYVTLQSN